MRDHLVAAMAVKEHADAATGGRLVEAAGDRQARCEEQSLLLVENPIEIGERGVVVGGDEGRVEAAAGEHRLDERALAQFGRSVEDEGKGRQGPPRLPDDDRRRDAGNRRGIEPTAQHRPDRRGTPQPAADSGREQIAELFDRIAGSRRSCRIKPPIFPQSHAARGHRERVMRRQAEDAGIESRMAVLDQPDEIVGDARLVDPERHIREGKQRLDLGGEDETGRAGVVIERLHAEMIAGAEQQVAASVPYGEGEVAEEMRWAFLAPPPVSGEDDRRVADRGVGKAQLGDQVLAIVEPRIGAHRDLALRQRLGFRRPLAQAP